jgi:tRNA(fMet)-specific endonuclease VapC
VRTLLGTVHALPFDAAAAMEGARIRAELESQGRLIGPYDLLLAGHAVAAQLILVTANTDEFSRVRQLKIENFGAKQ